jgi:hypothetical protein
MRSVAFPGRDTVVILDVLHYVERREQDEVLARVRSALRQRRSAVAARRRRRVATALRGEPVGRSPGLPLARLQRGAPQSGRPVAEWVAQLVDLGFEVSESRWRRGRRSPTCS